MTVTKKFNNKHRIYAKERPLEKGACVMWVIAFLAIKTHENARLRIHAFCLVIVPVPFSYLGLYARKPIFSDCEQQRHSLICAFVFRFQESIIDKYLNTQASPGGYAPLIESYLVANSRTGFLETRPMRGPTHEAYLMPGVCIFSI